LVEVILVIVFRRIEHGERRELGDDRLVPYFLALQLGDDFLRGRELLLRVVEDHGAILCADVAALPVEGGGIVDREQHAEQVAIRDDVGVERDLCDFGVAGRSAAHLLVRGVRPLSTRVTAHDLFDSAKLTKRGIETPEATAPKRGELAHFVRSPRLLTVSLRTLSAMSEV